jgi:hypothetical protein
MVTPSQCDAAYHCGIGDLLTAAYQRTFTMLEMGKCKTKYATFEEWYATLNEAQRLRVDASLKASFNEK